MLDTVAETPRANFMLRQIERLLHGQCILPPMGEKQKNFLIDQAFQFKCRLIAMRARYEEIVAKFKKNRPWF